jgi:hypothetical protein
MRDPANVDADLSMTGDSTLCTMSQRTEGSHLVRGSGGSLSMDANMTMRAATGPATTQLVRAVGATSGATSTLVSATGAASRLVRGGTSCGTLATEATEATGAATARADSSTEVY